MTTQLHRRETARTPRLLCAVLALAAMLGFTGPAQATVYYDVYQGTGTSGTLLLGFNVPSIISSTGEAIAGVIGTEASFFPAGTDATDIGSGIGIPNGVDEIFKNNLSNNIDARNTAWALS